MINLQVQRRRPRIELVPMIDVVFCMLIFFMLFSTLKTAQTGVAVDLPKTFHLGRAEDNTVIVTIAKDTRVYFGSEAMTLEKLATKVRQEIERDPATRVVVKPDATVSYDNLVRVMDALADSGVERPLLGVDRQQIPKRTNP